MKERRAARREQTEIFGVRAQVTRADKTTFEGVVVDISTLGAGISGGAGSSLCRNDPIEVVFLYLNGERVAYRGVVRHVDAERDVVGVEFLSEPVLVRVEPDAPSERVSE